MSEAKNPEALFADEPVPELTEEQERYKRQLYEKMNPRRRKFVDRIGYEVWNPFQEPKEPLDIRRDRTQRTLEDLLTEFFHQNPADGKSREWKQGATECALGIIQKNEKFQGIYDFCLWYQQLLQKEKNRL